METTPSTSTRWNTYERIPREHYAVYQQAGINYLHAQLLYNRGLRTPEAMQAFLTADYEQTPDAFLLNDMQRAVERISLALRRRESIVVYGDFDADGVTSAALCTLLLRKLKHPESQLAHFIPSRLHDVRGLSLEALQKIAATGATLVITTDCGSSDVEAVAYAKTRNIDIIITDHHHPPEELPEAYALLNPWRADTTYPERYLCGVGVAFKLAQALLRAHGRSQEALELLDLVAIGTIGDVAQLLGENHTLVRLGLRRLNQTRNHGLRALIQTCKLQPGKIRERDISYTLAPRINAAGRMQHADIAFHLLTTENESEAQSLAQALETLNYQRQQQTEELMKLVREQAQHQPDKQVILVYGDKETWPEGIIGLVAGKLSEETKRPVFVLSQDKTVSRGSARSQEGFNIISALRAARPDLFERYGGHAQAAGFTIANAHIAELHAHLLDWYEQSLSPSDVLAVESEGAVHNADANLAGVVLEQEVTPPAPGKKIDMVLTKPELLTLDMLQKISLLSPFGSGNPEPVFRLDGLRLTRRWASGAEGRNLRVRLRAPDGQQFQGTLPRGGARTTTLHEGAEVRIVFSLEPSWNTPDGEQKEVWLKLLDIEIIAHKEAC